MSNNPLVHSVDNQLFVENVSLARIAAEYGTPCYVYSKAALVKSYTGFASAFPARETLICYAAKANSNLAILGLFAELGAGFDIVSEGELMRVLAAGGDPRKVVFSGVGKRAEEMRTALRHDILCFNVESEPELLRLAEVATEMGKRAPISIRVNPDVDPKTHPYIATGLKENKFGVAFEAAPALYRRAQSLSSIEIVGIDCHIGSQITEISPFADALEKVLQLVDRLEADGISLHHIDLGGGIGIRYKDEDPIALDEYAQALSAGLMGRNYQLIFEPGRHLVGNAGLLLTRVEYIKQGGEKHFAIVDAAMNDLIRPALYDAYHQALSVAPRAGVVPQSYDIVGPVCESGDFLARQRLLALEPGDLVALMSAGAYGSVMSSNYNTRPRPAEIMIDGASTHLIRARERVQDLYAHEKLLP
jgi:diaminopimelate decarboxylase